MKFPSMKYLKFAVVTVPIAIRLSVPLDNVPAMMLISPNCLLSAPPPAADMLRIAYAGVQIAQLKVFLAQSPGLKITPSDKFNCSMEKLESVAISRPPVFTCNRDVPEGPVSEIVADVAVKVPNTSTVLVEPPWNDNVEFGDSVALPLMVNVEG